MMWHAGIDIKSAISVITKICQQAGDTGKLQKRIDTVIDTYAKANKGLKIAGTTEFITLIRYLNNCTTEEAENVIGRIKLVWRVDALGPELKQPIIIGLGGNKNKNKSRSNKNNDYSEGYSDSYVDFNFRSPSSAEILLDLAEKKIVFLFANQFDECYACILVPNRVPLIYYEKEGFRIGIDHSDSNGLVNHNAQDSHLWGYHSEITI
jgi:hypothetical protein